MGRQWVLGVLVGLSLIGCDPSGPDQWIASGHSSLNSGDAQTALASFQEAAAALEPSDPRFLDAKLGVVEALIRAEPIRAREEFLALSTSFPEQVGQKQFEYMGGLMVSSKQYMEASKLVHNGIQRFGPEATKLRAMIDRIQQESVNDSAVQDALVGLGYVK